MTRRSTTEGSGASRGGGEEFHNEDVFLAKEGLGLYVVCDGDGDRPAGEVAAALAARAVASFITECVEKAGDDLLDEHTMVSHAMQHASDSIRDASRRLPAESREMRASVTMLLTDGCHGTIGHRGDSRLYLIRNRRQVQLTADQTDQTEQTDETSETRGEPEIQVFSVGLRPGDTLILCTDGAETVVEDPGLVRIAGALSPRLLASRIVGAASHRSPSADATAVAVRVRGAENGRAHLELSEPVEETAFGHTLKPQHRKAPSKK